MIIRNVSSCFKCTQNVLNKCKKGHTKHFVGYSQLLRPNH